MSALETGRFLDDALKRAGRPPGKKLDKKRLGEFVAVARFFRADAESRSPDLTRQGGADAAASSQSAAARQIYQTILDGAARRYLAIPHAGNARPDARSVYDTGLAERLATWSLRWGRAEAAARDDPGSRFIAVRSHFERMASLEDGRALHEALVRAGGSGAPSPPPEFADVARFFRLEARWEVDLVRSR
jgi:hypothetical protein